MAGVSTKPTPARRGSARRAAARARSAAYWRGQATEQSARLAEVRAVYERRCAQTVTTVSDSEETFLADLRQVLDGRPDYRPSGAAPVAVTGA